MSKPIVRIIFTLLIALALVIGIYTSVQGATAGAGAKSAQADVGADVNFGLDRNPIWGQELDDLNSQADPYGEPGRDCDSDKVISPEDY